MCTGSALSPMRVPPMRAVPRLPTHTLVSASAAAAAILSSCILLVAPGPSLAAELGAGAVVMDRVDRVVDGDTLVLDTLGRVRLIGMNTPEVVAPAQRQGAPPQCYGPEASAATKALLPQGSLVRLETDKAPRDKYGRALAYVFREPDDTFINGRLVEQGFARVKARASETAALQPPPCSPALVAPTGPVNRGPDLRPQTYKPNTRYEGLLTSLQSEAKAQRHGSHGVPHVRPPCTRLLSRPSGLGSGSLSLATAAPSSCLHRPTIPLSLSLRITSTLCRAPHQANRRGLWGQCETPSPPSPPSRPSTPSPPPPPPPASAKAAPQPAARAADADSRRADATVLPNPGDSKNCKDFASYGEAKAWFDKYYPMYGDVAKLDGNGDGRPCESLLPKSGGR